MQTKDVNQVRHNVSRILLISPEQNELVRRNKSRIFVWPAGESIIDSIMFQPQRPISTFIDDAIRAMDMAGLHDMGYVDGDRLTIGDGNTLQVGAPKHLTSHGWLTIDNKVYDLIVEVDVSGERLKEPNVMTVNATPAEDNPFENPLVIIASVDDFRQNGEDIEYKSAPIVDFQSRPAMAARRPKDTDESPEGRMTGRPGRVKNPLLDGRLKRNRSTARRSQDGERSVSHS